MGPDTPTGADLLPRIAFVGLHGGVFDALKSFETPAQVQLEYVTDEQIAASRVDFSVYRLVLIQHTRAEDREQYRRLIVAGRAENSALRIISISGLAEKMLPDLAHSGAIEHDPQLEAYYGSSVENLRRMLQYIGIRYLGWPGTPPPPESTGESSGLYHPDHEGLFTGVDGFIAWAATRGRDIHAAPRAVVAVHATHLTFQQPQVVDALVRALEAQGALAVAMNDLGPQCEQWLLDFHPHVVIHTCHSGDNVSFREKLAAPHLHSIFFRTQSIQEWRRSDRGLAASEVAFHITGQELLGAIEPQIAAGTEQGGGSAESFLPIPDRVEHLAARALAWARLATTANRNKKIAVIYYDRELGKSELLRGSATGMFMNGPRSLVKVLQRMQWEGYRLTRVPADEHELLDWLMDHGRQIGVWAPVVLSRLAESGKAVLIPAEQYKKWFDQRLSAELRQRVVERWGPPPGKFLTWEDPQRRKFIVVPRVDLGSVILLPQPLRGEAHDTSAVHDKLVPPPHNYLATYFWLELGFGADALVHFGTHGSEFLLPGKPVGLSGEDWSDLLLGSMPNINPWIVNNLGESSPARRRAYAVLIDHLTPPSVSADLSDELLNLHNDIDRWVALAEGPLKDKFRSTISDQVRAAHLDRDLQLDADESDLLAPADIERVLTYLHDIHNETTPVNLHVFGEPPRPDLLLPYLATCLGESFIEALGEAVAVPAGEALTPGDRRNFLRRVGEELLARILSGGLTPPEALTVVAGADPASPLPDGLGKSLELARQLAAGFAKTPDEMDNLIGALNGRFIAPGPGNGPDRNPSVLPTGRNMYVMNPEEVPTRPSWELGVELVDGLLAQWRSKRGGYPDRIGFTLSSFATFQDYGVMESQMLYLIGARPVWDARNLVVDAELIPPEELGRPRIDVFIAGQSYYRDMLPTRMRLLDKAVRLVADADEPDNRVRENTRRVRRELRERGIPDERATTLAGARIFGYPPGQIDSTGYYYLVERSGQWSDRADLMSVYLDQVRYAYTEGMWGEHAPEAYERQIQGTELVLRSWSDRTTSPLSNKYTWYHGGSLCLAVKHLTGKEPEFFLSDVRDPVRAQMISAEDALRRDFRVRLFNRKWIEGMKQEGYAGADQIAVHVSNAMGWKIMRPNSVGDDLWEEIVSVYIRDSKHLAIREWFESENPYAFQDLTEVLLETVRKGYWSPDAKTLHEIARAYAESVARHGEGGGLRGGGNVQLDRFVATVLDAPGSEALLASYRQALDASTGNAAVEMASEQAAVPRDAAPSAVEALPLDSSDEPTATGQKRDASRSTVEGYRLEQSETADSSQWWLLFVGSGTLLLLLIGWGAWRRIGAP